MVETTANSTGTMLESGVKASRKILGLSATGIIESGKVATQGRSLDCEGVFKVIK